MEGDESKAMICRFWRRIKPDRSGAALTDLIAGLAVASLVALSAGSILTSSMGAYREYTRQAFIRLNTDDLCDFLRKQLIYSHDLQIETGVRPDSGSAHVIEFKESGEVCFDGAEFVRMGAGSGSRFFCRVKVPEPDEDDGVLEMYVDLENQTGDTLYSGRIVIKLLNPEVSDGSLLYALAERPAGGMLDSRDDAVYFCYNSAYGEEELADEEFWE